MISLPSRSLIEVVTMMKSSRSYFHVYSSPKSLFQIIKIIYYIYNYKNRSKIHGLQTLLEVPRSQFISSPTCSHIFFVLDTFQIDYRSPSFDYQFQVVFKPEILSQKNRHFLLFFIQTNIQFNSLIKVIEILFST